MKNNNKGFSLVELIVVIAIMAILAAVAVVSFSLYIPKAQQANDKQLIGDIEYALTLAGADGTTLALGEGGYIILTTSGVSNADDIKANNPKLAQILADSYGENWATEMKLSYDKWGNNGLSDGLSGFMAGAVKDSSYMSGNRVDALLGDVEKMTGMAQNLVTALSNDSTLDGMSLSALFTPDVLNATGKKYGIGADDWDADDWEAWGAQEENKVAYGNLLVLAAADDIENHKSDGQLSPASDLIMNFSSYYAFAAQNEVFSDVLDEKLDALQNVNSTTAGKTWYEELEAAAIAAGYDQYRYQMDASGAPVLDDEGNKVFTQQYQNDVVAFGTVMSGLGNPSKEQADILANDLNNANLFTEGVGNAMYNDYMDAVEIADTVFGSEESITIPEGSVAIMCVQTAKGMVVYNSLVSEQ